MTEEGLSISREEFREIYAGLPILGYEDLFYSRPDKEKALFEEYLPSKLWRLNNVYTIVDKWGAVVRFRMNRSQHLVYAAHLRHPRLIILKSRQQGISTLWLVSFFDDAITRPNLSIGLMAQGIDEAETLLGRVTKLWEHLNPAVKELLGIRNTVDNTKEFSLSNGSSIFIRTSFRSATLQRLHISEMGKIANKFPEKAQETKTGTLQALAPGNTGVVESTAEGDNLFKDEWDKAVTHTGERTKKDFFPVFLSWLDDPDCNEETDQVVSSKARQYFDELEADIGRQLTRTQRNFWVMQFRELGEKVYQEYPSTATEAFMATKQGAYYAKLFLEYVKLYGRDQREDLYDKNLDVQLAVDLGMNDTNSLCPFQTYVEEFRIIDEFYDSGQPIKYYTDWIKEQEWWENLTHVILPHDAEVKELTSGLTRTQVFERELCEEEYGGRPEISITVLPRTDVNDGIDMVREVVKVLWISSRCEYLAKCLVNYKKQWDEKRNRWRNQPDHDEYSNGADSIRYMAVGAVRASQPRKPKSRNYDGLAVRARGMDV